MADKIMYYLHDFWYEIGEPQSQEYFWLGTPWPTLAATAVYLYLVLKFLPDYMRNRKPYDLKLIIRFYNLLLVYINAYLFMGALSILNWGLDCWGCNQDESPEKRAQVLWNVHMFFHTRYLEFFDTFFFLLRKKNSQLTFLHLFHHGIVPILMYQGLKFYPIPFNSWLPITNTFVHIIMYLYYGLATFGPAMQKHLWWKKYLTSMQIGQFVMLVVQSSQAFVLTGPGCNFPMFQVYMNIGIGLTFFGLFVSFYRETYQKQREALARSKLSKVNHEIDVDLRSTEEISSKIKAT